MKEELHWRKCSICKKAIGFNSVYQACSVSSCRKWAYCSVDCWDAHNPVMNHKSSWAEEKISPSQSEVMVNKNETPRRKIVSSPSSSKPNKYTDILIVTSKLKSYVKSKHGLNTSKNVMDALSDIVRHYADQAAQKAKQEGRKTLMDRDF